MFGRGPFGCTLYRRPSPSWLARCLAQVGLGVNRVCRGAAVTALRADYHKVPNRTFLHTLPFEGIQSIIIIMKNLPMPSSNPFLSPLSALPRVSSSSVAVLPCPWFGKSSRHLSSSSATEPIFPPLTHFGRTIEDDYASIRTKYGWTYLDLDGV